MIKDKKNTSEKSTDQIFSAEDHKQLYLPPTVKVLNLENTQNGAYFLPDGPGNS